MGRSDARVGHAARRGRAHDVRPHRAGLRRDEPRHDGRASTGAGAGSPPRRPCAPGTSVLDACCGTGDLALADLQQARRGSSGSTSRRGCSSGRAASRTPSSGCRATCSRCRSRPATFDAVTVGFGVRNVDGPRGGPARAAARPAARRPARRARDHAAARPAAAVLPPLVRRARAARGQGASRRKRLHVPAGVRAALPRTGGSRGRDRAQRVRRASASACSPAASSPCTRPRRREHAAGASADAQPYLDELEERLHAAVASQPGLVERVGAEARRRRRQAPAAAPHLPRQRRPRDGRFAAASRSSWCTWRRSSTTT